MDYLLEEILYNALSKNTSDIHITSRNNKIIIDFRIKGILEHYLNLDQSIGIKLINYIKFLANIDLNYRFSYQTGAFEYNLKSQIIPLRVSFIPTNQGNNLVIRILGQHHFSKLEDLTIQQEAINYFNQLIKASAGLILMSGPTGVGKSTTLHTILNLMYQKQRLNIITIEDPIEIFEPNFIQIQLNFNEELDFESALKQILRHDPDVVMIGEIRDELSAKIAIRLALTGCLVFATIHAKNCVGTLKRLFNLGLNPIDIHEVLLGVISQRLLFVKSTAIYEWLSKEELERYYENSKIGYKTFENHLKQMINDQIILESDLKGTEFEK